MSCIDYGPNETNTNERDVSIVRVMKRVRM